MRRSALSRIAVGVALALGLWAPLAHAQPRSPMLIRQQLEASLNYQIRAIHALEDPEQARKLTWDAYYQMRNAHANVTINASSAKFPDPLFPLHNQRMEQARTQILAAHDALKGRNSWNGTGNPLDIARAHLNEAVRLTRIIVATTF